jgi:hypothetical protein
LRVVGEPLFDWSSAVQGFMDAWPWVNAIP